MYRYFAPARLSPSRHREVDEVLHRIGGPGAPAQYDIEIYDETLTRPPHAFTFYADRPSETVRQILKECGDLSLPLARHLEPFRAPVVTQTIHRVSRDNALFSLATAVPDVLPSLLSLPWAVGEFASDTAFLTMNQVRMAFLIAAANDQAIGYSEQRSEIASLVAGAFGWRALARELAGKIPFGGGLIPKAAIAYAGTYVVGLSLDRVNRLGYDFSRRERHAAYEQAYAKGKEVASYLMELLRRRKADPVEGI